MEYKSRKESYSGIYHVMIRGINHELIFEKSMYKYIIKGLLREKAVSRDVQIYAYCIMDSHLHLLIKAPIQVLSEFMSSVQSSYARFYNSYNSRNGHVFQNRFKSECIESMSYFQCCMNYIHKNPVKAGLCKEMEAYPFSSLYEVTTKRLAVINNEAYNIIQNQYNTSVHELQNTVVFEDVPEEKLKQQIAIINVIIDYIKDAFHLQNIAEIFVFKNIYEKIIQKIKVSFKLGNNKAIDFFWRWYKKQELST